MDEVIEQLYMVEEQLKELREDYDLAIKTHEKLQKEYDELSRKYNNLITAIWKAL